MIAGRTVEALTNAPEHAKAHRAGILLSRENGGVLAVTEDDGHRFDPETICSGLVGMRAPNAGGQLPMEARRVTGTTVAIEVPVG
jgi:signal transduction histidine kinase